MSAALSKSWSQRCTAWSFLDRTIRMKSLKSNSQANAITSDALSNSCITVFWIQLNTLVFTWKQSHNSLVLWGCSSVGRAFALHVKGLEFESRLLQNFFALISSIHCEKYFHKFYQLAYLTIGHSPHRVLSHLIWQLIL